MINDQVKAVALKIAYERFRANGGKFENIGIVAAQMIKNMEKELGKQD